MQPRALIVPLVEPSASNGTAATLALHGKRLFPALQVAMDRYMGCVSNELATITGLELTVAPRRPAHMTHK